MKQLKIILTFLTICLTMCFSSCASSSTASNGLLIDTINRHGLPTETPNKPKASEPKSLFVILSSVEIRGNKIELNDFWGHEENEEESKLFPDGKFEIDIMNCAGYLASATTTYKMEGGMRKVFLKEETIAKDAIEKINQCQSNNEMSLNRVFGIAPHNTKRKNIKIGKIDTEKLYNSLFKDIAETKKVSPSEANPISQITATKGNLFLGDDNWTDSDGGGQIDLIEFHDTPCENENAGCTWIFHLVDGKWVNIDYVSAL